MKKFFSAMMLCLVCITLSAQNVEYNTRAYSITEQDPILEAEDGNVALTITPQRVVYYDCQGQEVKSFIQYNIAIYTKFMGMTTVFCDQTISGETLCLLKVLAQKTKESMANGGKEGLHLDNGLIGSDRFSISVSEFKPFMMKRGWYMSINTGRVTAQSTGYLTLNRRVTSEFVNVLATMPIE